MKPTLEEMIAVMQAAQEGKLIEVSENIKPGWGPAKSPLWNWAYCTYRVQQTDLVIPWDALLPKFKWAAQDEDGSIYVYVNEPTKRFYDAWSNGGSTICVNEYLVGVIPSTKPWTETLIQRPE